MKIIKKSFEGSGILLLTLTMIGNILNYTFQIMSGRSLSVIEYGSLSVLFSFIALAAVPTNTMAMVVSRNITLLLMGDDYRYRRVLSRTVYIIFGLSLVVIAIGCVVSGSLATVIRVERTSWVILSFVIIGIGFMMSIITGVFQGAKRFLALGLFSLSLPVIKLFGLVPTMLGSDNQRISIILWTLIIGNVLILIVYTLYLKNANILNSRQEAHKNYNLSENVGVQISRFVIMAAITSLGIAFISNMDILIVKRFFNGTESGLYSSAMIFGKVILYIPNALISVMFPMVTESDLRKENSNRILIKTILYTLIISLVALIFVAFFKESLISILYGVRYINATQYVLWSMSNYVPISLLIVMTNFYLAKMEMRFILTTIIIGITTILIITYFLHDSIKGILIWMFIVNMLVLVANLINMLLIKKDNFLNRGLV